MNKPKRKCYGLVLARPGFSSAEICKTFVITEEQQDVSWTPRSMPCFVTYDFCGCECQRQTQSVICNCMCMKFPWIFRGSLSGWLYNTFIDIIPWGEAQVWHPSFQSKTFPASCLLLAQYCGAEPLVWYHWIQGPSSEEIDPWCVDCQPATPQFTRIEMQSQHQTSKLMGV